MIAETAGDIASKPVIHWYDFICPFCYLAQPLNDMLRAAGAEILFVPFEVHPEIPAQGLFKGARVGAMYDDLNKKAQAAELQLRWPPRFLTRAWRSPPPLG